MDWEEIKKGLQGTRVVWHSWKFIQCDMRILNFKETKSLILGVELLECFGPDKYNKNSTRIRFTKEWAETLLRDGRLEMIDFNGFDNIVTIS